jgi:hypothetical protein
LSHFQSLVLSLCVCPYSSQLCYLSLQALRLRLPGLAGRLLRVLLGRFMQREPLLQLGMQSLRLCQLSTKTADGAPLGPQCGLCRAKLAFKLPPLL